MTKKIINIKNILRIIISVMVIFSMAKSCAKALTYDDIKEYVNLTADYFSGNSYYQTIKSIINNMNTAQKNNVDTMGSGYENVVVYLTKQSGRTYITIKVFHANSLVISTQSITYTGNYKIYQWQNGWGNVYGPYNETNTSIDGGFCYSRNANYENSLQGMCYLGQSPTSRYRLSGYFCRNARNTTMDLS